MQSQDIEIQLWEYIDGQGRVEKEHISIMIARDPIWKAKYEELLAFHNSIAKLETDQPSLRFTQNVLDAVSGTQIANRTDKYLNHLVIKGIAAFFSIVIIGLLGYAFESTNWQAGVVSNIGYSKLFGKEVINTFITINIFLSLILLDSLLRKTKRTHRGTEQ